MTNERFAQPRNPRPYGDLATPALTASSNHTLAWITLLALTLGSFVLGSWLGGRLLPAAVILIALTKTGLVAHDFMGFGRVARHWQWLMASYLVILSVLLVLAFC